MRIYESSGYRVSFYLYGLTWGMYIEVGSVGYRGGLVCLVYRGMTTKEIMTNQRYYNETWQAYHVGPGGSGIGVSVHFIHGRSE